MSLISRKEGKWNADRVFFALGRIGYHPVSALLDIADNSQSWEASHIAINIGVTSAPSQGPGRRRATISSFTIIDNGTGMDEHGLDNALTLGSSPDGYSEQTLSKFGMGLKSAAFSLGTKLEVVSCFRDEPGVIRKVVTDRERILDAGGKYVYDLEVPSSEDVAELRNHCGDGAGTLIRITQIHLSSMPSVAEIVGGLKQKAGVVYHYFLSGNTGTPLTITVDGHSVQALDPLYIDQISDNLDETSWDGLTPKWITRPSPIQLDTSGTRTAEVAIVQLPHPPSLEKAKQDKSARREAREDYMIGAGNYGFFIYRNNRLISWADSLDGMVTSDKKLYGFRGRLLISSDADDLLNIDVTKSNIRLSEIAVDQLKSHVTEAVRKSRNAWEYRTDAVRYGGEDSPHEIINEVLNELAELDERDDQVDEQIAVPSERKVLETRRKQAIAAKPANTEETKRLQETGERVQYVEFLANNQLWERAHDPSAGLIVRVNKSHRFMREIFQNTLGNAELTKVLDTVFFALARGEYELIYKSERSASEAEAVMQEYRERVGGAMSEIVRRMKVGVVLDDT